MKHKHITDNTESQLNTSKTPNKHLQVQLNAYTRQQYLWITKQQIRFIAEGILSRNWRY
jgi:hypothetical protein